MTAEPLRLASALILLSTLHASAAVLYVDVKSTNPVSPYINWATAATAIQNAVDAANPGDTVLVTNGVYQSGGRIVYGTTVSNIVALTKPLTLQSVNGPDVTIIKGNRISTGDVGPTRCAYLTNGATLSGFTLTNGGTRLGGDVQREQSGGGVWGTSASSVVSNCVIVGNYAQSCGSGVYSNTLFNCAISNNLIYTYGVGGAVYNGTVYNCTISSNTGGMWGAGAYQGTLFGSVLSSNLLTSGSGTSGGGAYKATLYDCNIMGNSAYASGGGVYQCTLSNCTLLGNSTSVSGGGAYQGTLSNCTLSSNRAGSLGGAAYQATLYNSLLISNTASSGGGVYGGALTNCTLLGNLSSSLAAGAYDSQMDSCMVVSNTGNGVWLQNPATLNNCLVMGNSGLGVNGNGIRANFTLNNCTFLFNGYVGVQQCVLSNCVVATNHLGGASGCVLTRCLVAGNSSTSAGGGANACVLTNCLVVGNSSTSHGGGAISSTLVNCTLVGNSAAIGGGADTSTLFNSIVYYNTSQPAWGSNTYLGTLNFCCVNPVFSGTGNFTNEPAFVDIVGGNLRLQSNSPCINAGNNLYTLSSADLDGNPRIQGGTVDIGAYEFQNPSSVISYVWLQQHGLSTDGTADFVDTDQDALNNWQEWIAGTDPTNSASVLKMLAPSKSASGLTLGWESVSGKTYYLQRTTDLDAPSPFVSIQSNIVGQVGTTTFSDTTATNAGPYFYRVGVQ